MELKETNQLAEQCNGPYLVQLMMNPFYHGQRQWIISGSKNGDESKTRCQECVNDVEMKGCEE